jgi:hypothetical protein
MLRMYRHFKQFKTSELVLAIILLPKTEYTTRIASKVANEEKPKKTAVNKSS